MYVEVRHLLLLLRDRVPRPGKYLPELAQGPHLIGC
jgi:hypothetical protein